MKEVEGFVSPDVENRGDRSSLCLTYDNRKFEARVVENVECRKYLLLKYQLRYSKKRNLKSLEIVKP